MKKFLIVGLGNPGEEYVNTRHNVGFLTLDAFAKASNVVFIPGRYAMTAETRIKGKTFRLIKPTTFMNLSGKAVRYWMNEENIPLENIIVVLDDLALPYGAIRLKGKGSDAGHNGLKDIEAKLGRNDYARLRFGIGSDFSKGKQVDYVLGEWNKDESLDLSLLIDHCVKACETFALAGLNTAMNDFNKK
ncbi:MAG: aminoacyl-tRNA hydrolase [Schleiferiaceae bacterium]|jgi:PTH1 family peptidyl-tRNA hydrolase|nr:aminoacyl-tRNA hydrolase [Schleiferiaceae bacterium]